MAGLRVSGLPLSHPGHVAGDRDHNGVWASLVGERVAGGLRRLAATLSSVSPVNYTVHTR